MTIGITLLEVSAFIALMLVVGRRVLPWLLWQVARTGSRELFTLSVVATAIGIAYGAAELFSVSFALGAFFAGTVMRESEFSHRAAQESLPLRDAFSVLFFVSVGMLFDPAILVEQPLQVLGVLAIIILGKTLAALALVARIPLPAQYGPDGRGQPGADRRVFVHSGRAGFVARLAAHRRHESGAGGRVDFNCPESLPVHRHCAGPAPGFCSGPIWRASWNSAKTLMPNCP